MMRAQTLRGLLFVALLASASGASVVAAAAAEPSARLQTAMPQDLIFTDDDFRKQQPAAAVEKEFRQPKPTTFTLKNGASVLLVEDHSLPLVSISVDLPGGFQEDADDKLGMAALCMNNWGESTDKLDQEALSGALQDHAASVSTSAARESLSLGMSAMTSHFDATFALFSDVLFKPGMRSQDFTRLAKDALAQIEQEIKDPDAISNRVQYPIVLGTGHASGRLRSAQTVSRVTLDECKTFATTWRKPKGAWIYAVGDITAAKLRKVLASGAWASWQGAGPKQRPVGLAQTQAGRIFFHHVPGAAQSSLQIVKLGPARNAPSYFADTVATGVLGGSFARLDTNLREGKGYSYGARSRIAHSRQFAILNASSKVRTDATFSALTEMHREMAELSAGKVPATDAELAREKNGRLRSLPASFATGQATIGTLSQLVYYGLPLDYYSSFGANIKGVTADAVAASAAKVLNPDDAVIIIVGDADAKLTERKDGKDVPWLKDGAPVTLHNALADAVKQGRFGPGALVMIDANAKPIAP
jgi:zinc protease